MPAWRGTLVVPAESQWIIHGCAADLTSRSLQFVVRANRDATRSNYAKCRKPIFKRDIDTSSQLRKTPAEFSC